MYKFARQCDVYKNINGLDFQASYFIKMCKKWQCYIDNIAYKRFTIVNGELHGYLRHLEIHFNVIIEFAHNKLIRIFIKTNDDCRVITAKDENKFSYHHIDRQMFTKDYFAKNPTENRPDRAQQKTLLSAFMKYINLSVDTNNNIYNVDELLIKDVYFNKIWHILHSDQ